MLSFLLPFASKIISDAVDKIPDNEELGEKLIGVCLVILKKAVKLTKTLKKIISIFIRSKGGKINKKV